jgi:hypothetical protein
MGGERIMKKYLSLLGPVSKRVKVQKMNRKVSYMMLYMLLVVILGIQLASAACVVPREDLVINQSSTLCSGTYNLVDANKNGVILFGVNNITITCNNTKFVGADTSGSYAIGFNFKDSATIQGCHISDYDTGVYSAHGDNNRIIGNTILSTKSHAIRLLENNNAVISRNTINNTMFDIVPGTYADNIYTYGNGIIISSSNGVYESNIIEYNKIDLVRVGVRVNANMIQSKIRYNNISNIGSWQGYAVLVEKGTTGNTEIYGNRIINGGWDAISVRSNNNIIRDNYIDSYYHHGYDSLCQSNDYTVICAKNNKIYNNYIIDQRLPDPEYNTPSTCIYIDQEINSEFYNNTCVNSIISSTGSPSQTYGNKIYGNSLINAPGNALYILSPAEVYQNRIRNTISYQGNMHDVTVGSDYTNKEWYTKSSFKNNIFEDGYGVYYFIISNSDISIIETYPILGYLDYGGSFNFSYTGVKNFKIVRDRLYIYNQSLQFPNNDIINVYTKKIIASNINNYNITLNMSTKIAIGNFNLTKTPPTANTTNSPPNTPIATIGIGYNKALNCSTTISDPDNDLLNGRVSWYKNSVFNHTNLFYNMPSGSKIQYTMNKSLLKIGDVWDCRIRIDDGRLNSSWGLSRSITINSSFFSTTNTPPSKPIVFIYSPDNTTNNNINCSTTVYDNDGDLINGRMSWYKNNIFNYTNEFFNKEPGTTIVYTLNKSMLKVNDTWDCRVRINDSKNNSDWGLSAKIKILLPPAPSPLPKIDPNLNTPDAATQPSQNSNGGNAGGGGGGGSGGGGAIMTRDVNMMESGDNTTNISTGSILTNSPDVESIQKTQDVGLIGISEETAPTESPQSTEYTSPILEQPGNLPINGHMVKNNPSKGLVPVIIVLLFGALTAFYFIRPKLELREEINKYIIECLHSGYEYDAIANALSKSMDSNTVHKHIKHLQNSGYSPTIRFYKPQMLKMSGHEKSVIISSLFDYIKSQVRNGFDLHNIRDVLLRYGHSYDVVEESFALLTDDARQISNHPSISRYFSA